jgi:hypothetical protein
MKDVWISVDRPLKKRGNDSFYLIQEIRPSSIKLGKRELDYEREEPRIPEERLTWTEIEEGEEVEKKWKRVCNSPAKALGLESLVYHNGDEFEEHVNSNTKEDSEEIDVKVDEYLSKMGDRILVQGGHYIPNLRKLSSMPNQPLKALEQALEIAERASKISKEADVLIFINDLHMGKDDGPQNRKEFFEDYALPDAVGELIQKYREKFDFNVYVAGERKLSDKLQRDKRSRIKDRLVETDEGYAVEVREEQRLVVPNQEVNLGGHPKCLAAVTRLYALVEQLGYDGLAQVYPVCGKSVAESAYDIAEKLYDTSIPVLNLYRTVTCFSNSTKARPIHPSRAK